MQSGCPLNKQIKFLYRLIIRNYIHTGQLPGQTNGQSDIVGHLLVFTTAFVLRRVDLIFFSCVEKNGGEFVFGLKMFSY
jgi:hypothetical protein